MPKYESLPFGAIIGKVNLIGPVESQYCFLRNQFEDNGDNWTITEQELAFGDYSPNRYGWLLSNPVLFEKPIPAKGKLGIWDWELEEKQHEMTVFSPFVIPGGNLS